MLEVIGESPSAASAPIATRKAGDGWLRRVRYAVLPVVVVATMALAGCVAGDDEGSDRPFPKLGRFPPVPETASAEERRALEEALKASRQEGRAVLPPPADAAALSAADTATEDGADAGRAGSERD